MEEVHEWFWTARQELEQILHKEDYGAPALNPEDGFRDCVFYLLYRATECVHDVHHEYHLAEGDK
jgi:hypothetical protein